MFKEIFENVKKTHPLIHGIINNVSVNDCANILIACGAAPVMADCGKETAEIQSHSDGLYLNLGMINSEKAEAMLSAGKTANELKHPVILDPVGAGISGFRKETALKLIKEIRLSVIRGNISEIKTLYSGSGNAKGVDAAPEDMAGNEDTVSVIKTAGELSKETGAVTIVSGEVDVVSDGERAYCIRNGHPMMSSVSGSGCQLSAMIAAFVSANPSCPLDAAAAAVSAFGLAGETAYTRLTEKDGNASFRNYIIDAVYNMTPGVLEKGAKYEVR